MIAWTVDVLAYQLVATYAAASAFRKYWQRPSRENPFFNMLATTACKQRVYSMLYKELVGPGSFCAGQAINLVEW